MKHIITINNLKQPYDNYITFLTMRIPKIRNSGPINHFQLFCAYLIKTSPYPLSTYPPPLPPPLPSPLSSPRIISIPHLYPKLGGDLTLFWGIFT